MIKIINGVYYKEIPEYISKRRKIRMLKIKKILNK